MKRILMYTVVVVIAVLYLFLKGHEISIEKISYNRFKVGCWLCSDFQKSLSNLCNPQYGWVISNQSLGKYNIHRSFEVSCKDVWGHYNKGN